MTDLVQVNPFFISLSDKGDNDLTYLQVKNEFKYVYFLVNKNKSNANINIFYDSTTHINDLIKQDVALYQIPFNAINYNRLKNKIVIVESIYLNNFNQSNYQLQNRELVIVMVDCRVKLIKKWYETTSSGSMDNYMEMKIFTYYNSLETDDNVNYLISFLNNLSFVNYWTLNKNLNLSCSDKFISRKFNIKVRSEWNLNTRSYDEKFSKLLQELPKNTTKLSYANIDKLDSKPVSSYSNLVKNKQLKQKMASYYDTKIGCDKSNIDAFEIENLICNNSTSEKEKLFISCLMLVSKDYFHLILKNENIMKNLSDLFEKYKPLYRYIFSYTWQCLFQEEQILKSNITHQSRHVFTLEQASLLPIFYFNVSDPRKNPYYSLNVALHQVAKDNLFGVDFPYNYQNGIVDIVEFKSRLNLFVCGKSDVNLFEGVDWNVCSITGGCMSAILPKLNPLMTRFSTSTNISSEIADDTINKFFDNFYKESDIDVVFTNMLLDTFLVNVRKFVDTIKLNINKKLFKNDNVTLTGHKNLHIYINKALLFKKSKKNELPFNFDFILNNLNDQKVKFYFYQIYLNQFNSIKNSAEFYNDIENSDIYIKSCLPALYEDITLAVTENDLNWTNVEKSKINSIYYENIIFIRFNEVLKFKITSPHIKHSIELFKMSKPYDIACVSRFHLPCVRSCYNGTTCYIMPSAITAYHCLTNIDFKYVCGTRDPLTILTKYRRRGYGIILNNHEIVQYLSNATTDPNNIYNLPSTSNGQEIMGFYPINSNLFIGGKLDQPTNIQTDKIINESTIIKASKITNTQDVINWYTEKYPKFNKQFLYNVIDDDGNINIFKKWIIEMSFDLQ